MKNNKSAFTYLAIALICLFVNITFGNVPVSKIVGLILLINIMSKTKETLGTSLKTPFILIIISLVVPFIFSLLLTAKFLGSFNYQLLIDLSTTEDSEYAVSVVKDFLNKLSDGSNLLIISSLVSLICDTICTFSIVKYVKSVSTLCANKEEEIYLENKSKKYFGLSIAVNIIAFVCVIIAVSLIPSFIEFIQEAEEGVEEFTFFSMLLGKGVMLIMLGIAISIISVIALVFYIMLIVKLFSVKDVKGDVNDASYVNIDAE